jgi:dsDNA-specific endonuclease/ATPase MutS2
MTDQNEQTPPWGDDFNAEKAWTLIQNLRADKTALSDKVETLTTDLATAQETAQAAETAKTEAEQRLTAEITAANDKAAAAARDLHVERVRSKYEIDDDLLEFLTGDTEEEIEAKAKRLGSAKKGKEEKEPEIDAATGLPKPALTPGHGGDQPTEFDPVAIAKAARAAR